MRGASVPLFVAILCACRADSRSPDAPVDQRFIPGWQLVWADEFNGKDGTRVDTTKWSAVTGGDGGGNQEREYNTDDLVTAQQRSGNLVITATREGAPTYLCWYGPCEYISARLQTKRYFEQRYGRFEARIKIAIGTGLWTGFWMLGNDRDSAGWPGCGEIDIMENIGKEPGMVHGTLHGPGYSGGDGITGWYQLPGSARLADDFHVFAVEWESETVRFYIDDVLYGPTTPSGLPPGTRWVFDHPFFLLLDLAVGGIWPGKPDGSTVFPQTMLIDYVRVYQRV